MSLVARPSAKASVQRQGEQGHARGSPQREKEYLIGSRANAAITRTVTGVVQPADEALVRREPTGRASHRQEFRLGLGAKVDRVHW